MKERFGKGRWKRFVVGIGKEGEKKNVGSEESVVGSEFEARL
jgi:hypothetical protein